MESRWSGPGAVKAVHGCDKFQVDDNELLANFFHCNDGISPLFLDWSSASFRIGKLPKSFLLEIQVLIRRFRDSLESDLGIYTFRKSARKDVGWSPVITLVGKLSQSLRLCLEEKLLPNASGCKA